MFKKILIILLSCLLLILGVSGTFIYLSGSALQMIQADPEPAVLQTEDNTEETTEEVSSESDTNITEIQSEVTTNEKSDRQQLLDEMRTSGDYDFDTLFEDCLFVGDSRTVGMVDYGYISSSRAIAEIGVRVDHLQWHENEVVSQDPEILIVSYGVNDEATYHADIDDFINTYTEIVNEVASRLPNTKIFVNSILPVKDYCATVNNSNIQDYNEKLEEMCDTYGYYFIDNTLVAEAGTDLYNADGLHFQTDFYPNWFFNMAQAICNAEKDW